MISSAGIIISKEVFMASYIIFWPKGRIESYINNGDNGPLSVIFGGPHQSQPPLGKIKTGDKIFPISVINGKMYILGFMEIAKIISEEEYIRNYLSDNVKNISAEENIMWDAYCEKNKKTITHKIPWNCVDNVAIGKNGTKIIKRELPEDKIKLIKLGPKKGEETSLKIDDGKIKTSNLIGYFRKLSETSEKIFEEVIKKYE
jgi:hypothetical protein